MSERVNIPPAELESQQEFTAGPVGAATWGNAQRRAELLQAPDGGNVVHIPNDAVGLIIGRMGSTIRQLEAETGVKIHIAKECAPGMNHRAITIQADNNQAMEAGKRQIL